MMDKTWQHSRLCFFFFHVCIRLGTKQSRTGHKKYSMKHKKAYRLPASQVHLQYPSFPVPLQNIPLNTHTLIKVFWSGSVTMSPHYDITNITVRCETLVKLNQKTFLNEVLFPHFPSALCTICFCAQSVLFRFCPIYVLLHKLPHSLKQKEERHYNANTMTTTK